MKRQLMVRLEAEVGIADAVNHYKTLSEGALQKFITSLDETFDILLASPHIYAIRWETTRRVNISRSSYALWYEIVPGKDSVTREDTKFIVVLRYFHQRLNVTPKSFE